MRDDHARSDVDRRIDACVTDVQGRVVRVDDPDQRCPTGAAIGGVAAGEWEIEFIARDATQEECWTLQAILTLGEGSDAHQVVDLPPAELLR